jgi:RNA polymerase sigma-70 factor (ECF subfamily)
METVTKTDVAIEFEQHRGHLTGVAYRMLGSMADAEDAVQDAWLRLQRVDRAEIEDLRGWLTTVTGRLCLDRLRSARVVREAYVGPWLPEPLVARLPDDNAPDPAELAVLDESIQLALLVVLERLTPEQRVAFVLHDVFGVPFDGVAGTLGVSAAAARQHASRARRAVHDHSPRRTAPLKEQRAVLDAFLGAARRGDLQGLVSLLDPGAELITDGGGIVQAARRPIEGAERSARFFLGILEKIRPTEWLAEQVLVNGESGAVFWIRPPGAGTLTLAGVVTLDVTPAGLVERVSVLVNPEKLTSLGELKPPTAHH